MYKWYAKASEKQVRQMVCRQSDGQVVPKKSGSPKGITDGGKSRSGEILTPPPYRTSLKGKH